MKIAIVTGGGDCPGLNTVIRATVKAATYKGWESYGVYGSYDGLLSPTDLRPLDYKAMDALLFRGGTILGTVNKGRFAAKTGHGETRRVPEAVLQEATRNFQQAGLDALVCIGGDGSLSIAQQLLETGIPVVGVPKTIDNDIAATTMTFGFETAVSRAVEALDRLRSTAESHGRVMVLEVMGRYAGWIAGCAGLAGGADVILMPEIDFRYESVCEKIRQREAIGKRFSLVVVSEGAKPLGGDYVTSATAGEDREARLGGIGHAVADEIQKRTGKETRCVVLGHLQRGGQPTQWDRQMCTRFGAYAVRMIDAGQFGQMVAMGAEGMAPVSLQEATADIKRVPRDGELVETARALGISFGDEVG
jgi:6-phosphofructokinase 1